MQKFNSVVLIKEICRDRGIPISQLERECGFGNAYLSNLKSGVLSSDRLFAASKYLDVPFEYLLTGEMPQKTELIDMPEYDARVNELIMSFSDLSEEQKNMILGLTKELSTIDSRNSKLEKYYNAYLAIIKGKK